MPNMFVKLLFYLDNYIKIIKNQPINKILIINPRIHFEVKIINLHLHTNIYWETHSFCAKNFLITKTPTNSFLMLSNY